MARSRGQPVFRGRRGRWQLLCDADLDCPGSACWGRAAQIKLTGDSAMEQRFRLEAEGVRFRGRRVDMKAHEWKVARAKRRGK